MADARPAKARRGRRTSISLTYDMRLLLEQCAAAAGTTAEEHGITLILRDAHRRGLLPSESLPAEPERTSVIAPFGDDPLSCYVMETPPAGLC